MKHFRFNDQTIQFVRDMCKSNRERADEIIEKARMCFESEQCSCLFNVNEICQGNNSFMSKIYLYRETCGDFVDPSETESDDDKGVEEDNIAIPGLCIHVVKVANKE